MVGERILTAICATDEKLRPEYISNAEPIKTPFVSIDDCKERWAPKATMRGLGVVADVALPFLWKRDRPIKYYGHVMHTSTNFKGQMTLGQVIVRSDIERGIDWSSIFGELCAIAKPKFGMLHLFTAPELAKAEFKSPQSSFQIGPAGWSLDSGIPNLGWANYLGDDFAADVDITQLAAHGFSAHRMGEDCLITTTRDLFDVADNFGTFSDRRSNLKKLFRTGLFQIETEPQ